MLNEIEIKEIMENFEERTESVNNIEMDLGDFLTLVNIADSAPFGKSQAITTAYKLGCLRTETPTAPEEKQSDYYRNEIIKIFKYIDDEDVLAYFYYFIRARLEIDD